MGLVDDIVRAVLDKRDIFVVVSQWSFCDDQVWDNVGVFDDLDVTKKATIRSALRSIDNFACYDPAHRYYTVGEGPLMDTWTTGVLGVSDFSIETWSLNTAGKTATLQFNLDAFIKQTIARDGLSSAEALLMLQGWRRDPPYDVLMPLFCADLKRYTDPEPDAHAWVALHGHGRRRYRYIPLDEGES